MKKVLLLSHASSLGGAQKCLELIARGLSATDYRPIVILPSRGPLESRLREIGVKTQILPLEYWVGTPYHWKRFAQGLQKRISAVCRIIREEGIHLVFTNTSVVVEGAIAAKICGVPHVWHVLEMLSRDPAFSAFFDLSILYRLMSSLSDRIVVVSKAVKDEIAIEIPRDMIHVIYTGITQFEEESLRPRIDILGELGVAADRPIVCFAGDLCKRKGVVDLVEVGREVSIHIPNVLFLIVGKDGGEKKRMLRDINSLSIEAHFRFLDFREDVLSIIAASDVFILPSRADPLPVVVLEAMMLGKPIVATRSGGCEEMVSDGVNGYLVPIRAPLSMAERLRTLLLDPALISLMGMRSAEIAKDLFAFESSTAAIAALIDDLFREGKTEGITSLSNFTAILLETMARKRIDADL
jgi:glycosyltransferase involved in cell wall biosynthesis